MDFFSIGSLHGLVKMKELNVKWQQRKANPFMKKGNDENPQVRQMREDMERMQQANRISSINGKLKAGAELSNEELEYLKEKSPALYKEAMEIRQERRAYKKRLQACKSKEEVDRVQMNVLQNFMAEVKEIRSNPNIPQGEKVAKMEKVLKRFMGVMNEHMKFVKTAEYQKLPEEDEEKKKEKEKKKKPSINTEELLEQERERLKTKTDNQKADRVEEETEEEETGEAETDLAGQADALAEELMGLFAESGVTMPSGAEADTARVEMDGMKTYSAEGISKPVAGPALGETAQMVKKA